MIKKLNKINYCRAVEVSKTQKFKKRYGKMNNQTKNRFTILALTALFIFCIFPITEINALDNGPVKNHNLLPGENSEKEKPQYVQGEVIVKLKEKEDIKTLSTMRYSKRVRKHKFLLSKLKTKHNLKNERPVFRHLHKKLKSGNLSLEESELQIEAKFPKRKSNSKDAKKDRPASCI